MVFKMKNIDYIIYCNGHKRKDGSEILEGEYIYVQLVKEVLDKIESEFGEIDIYPEGTNFGTHIVDDAKKRLGL